MSNLISKSWDDLRFFMALARKGSVAGAARDLSVNVSTVFRRLDRLEESVGQRLFLRRGGEYCLTEQGQDLLVTAEQMETALLGLDHRWMGQDGRLSGRLVVTASDALGLCFLLPQVASFQKNYPDVEVELVSDNRRLDLSAREADLALRIGQPEEEGLYARRLMTWGVRVYGPSSRSNSGGSSAEPSKSATEEKSLPAVTDALKDWPLLLWSDPYSLQLLETWLEHHNLRTQVRFRTTSLLSVAEGAAMGMGRALLPEIIGDNWPGIVRCSQAEEGMINEAWMVTHPDLRKNARVAAFMSHLQQSTPRGVTEK